MKNEEKDFGPRYKMIIDPRTTIYLKTDGSLEKWKKQFPDAEVVDLKPGTQDQLPTREQFEGWLSKVSENRIKERDRAAMFGNGFWAKFLTWLQVKQKSW